MKEDNIHYNLNKILSHNKPFNFVISAREAGKTTNTWLRCFKKFKQGKTILVIRRQIADITEAYIESIESVINKFQEKENQVKFSFRKNMKEGIVDVSIDGKIFFRVIALSNPMSRIKSLMLPHLKYLIFDEFICNTRMGEKYLTNEVFKFKELFNTFNREVEDGLICIFLGNPYSLYNPYFGWKNVNAKKIYPGSFEVGEDWIIECYELLPELKEKILQDNPLYKFDDSYKEYAFDGRAINDTQIRLFDHLPDNYLLQYVFYIENQKLLIFKNNSGHYENNDLYYVQIVNEYKSERRDIFSFNFNDLVDGTILMSNEEKSRFNHLKIAFRFRKILFKSIQESYLFEEIYSNL